MNGMHEWRWMIIMKHERGREREIQMDTRQRERKEDLEIEMRDCKWILAMN